MAKLKAQLVIWRRRLNYRKRRLAIARKDAHAGSNIVTDAEAERIHKWALLVERAEGECGKLAKAIAAKAPLRERAWKYMQADIDAKITEHGGNNRGHAVEARIKANGGIPGEAWCGDQVAWCYLKAGAKSVTRSWAAVRLLERVLTKVLRPKLGHVVTYTFDHTGLFKCWAPEKGKGWFWAGEGNTGNTGAASDSITGSDGVKLKLRHTSQVAGYWRVLR